MEKSSIHEKGTVQSEPETQKGPNRGRHIHPSRGGHIRALTLPLGQVTPGRDENQRPGVKLNRDAVGKVPNRPDMARNQLAPQGGPSPG